MSDSGAAQGCPYCAGTGIRPSLSTYPVPFWASVDREKGWCPACDGTGERVDLARDFASRDEVMFLDTCQSKTVGQLHLSCVYTPRFDVTNVSPPSTINGHTAQWWPVVNRLVCEHHFQSVFAIIHSMYLKYPVTRFVYEPTMTWWSDQPKEALWDYDEYLPGYDCNYHRGFPDFGYFFLKSLVAFTEADANGDLIPEKLSSEQPSPVPQPSDDSTDFFHKVQWLKYQDWLHRS